jgi:hypothetical protein
MVKPWHDELSDLILLCGNEEVAMVKPWHDELQGVITPGLDPGVFFVGNEEVAMVKPWHDELSDLILLCQQRRGCHGQAMT